MSKEVIQLPVRCPVCGSELVTQLRATTLSAALVHGRPIRLHAACHNEWWNASAHEKDQVREYLGAYALS